MLKEAFLVLGLSFFCILMQAFFSSFEMAALSFNKLRLEYLALKKNRSAERVLFLLKKPSRLFGTTLIMVTAFLQLGSEAARRFYLALGLNADLAPISQIVLVVIFGELAPLFAARRYSEQVALFSVKIVYMISRLLSPLIFLLGKITSFFDRLFKTPPSDLFLSKEELQKAFEEKDSPLSSRVSRQIGTIFNLKNLEVKKVALPLKMAGMVDSRTTLFAFKKHFAKQEKYFLVYHDQKPNIVGVLNLEKLFKLEAEQRVVLAASSPWFVTENSSLLSLIEEFRFNHQKVAVVLDTFGHVAGFLPLELIVDLIFENKIYPKSLQKQLELTLKGKTKVVEFNQRFEAKLPFLNEDETLSNLINRTLGHHPSEGDMVRLSGFELRVKQPALFGSKKVIVRSGF
ncbi:MAG: CNNM domain-containing protein [Parachlamydiales bacterium]|jgi:CBS domain containing-hemolysin-like protein